MGLFGTPIGACHICQGKVEEGNGMYFDTSDIFVQTDCVRRNLLRTKRNGLDSID